MNAGIPRRNYGQFSGTWAFLSNLWQEPDGLSVEHRFQAARVIQDNDKAMILRAATATEARRIATARRLSQRADWDDIKLDVMRQLVEDKFRDPTLRQKLLETGDMELVEGSHWDDTYWGVDLTTGEGENHLGIILMEVRDRIRRGEL